MVDNDELCSGPFVINIDPMNQEVTVCAVCSVGDTVCYRCCKVNSKRTQEQEKEIASRVGLYT